MATRRWLGRAVDIAQVDTITIANTWAAADTITLTVNNKDLVVTIGSLITTAQVATTLKQAIENETFTDTTASKTPANGKNDIGEMKEFTATVNGSVVTLTGNTRGKPFTLTVTESTAGDGTATEATATAATGKSFFDNQDNWSGNTVPVTADDIVFDQGDTDLLYNINTSVRPDNVFHRASYTGNIGLRAVNQDADDENDWYDEYRPRFLVFGGVDGTISDIRLGMGQGLGSQRILIDLGTHLATLNIFGNVIRDIASEPVMQFKGTDAVGLTANIRRGDVAFGRHDGETCNINDITIGYVDNIDGDSNVYLGPGSVPGSTTPSVQVNGGVLRVDSRSAVALTYTQTAGLVELIRGEPGTMVWRGGRFIWNAEETQGGGETNTISGNAIVDFDQDLRSKTVSPFERHSDDSQIIDNNGVIASLIVRNNHISNLSNIQGGTNFQWTRAAVP